MRGGGSRPLLDNVQKEAAFFQDYFPKVGADACKVTNDLERLERAGLLRDGSMLLAVQKCHLCSTKNSC